MANYEVSEKNFKLVPKEEPQIPEEIISIHKGVYKDGKPDLDVEFADIDTEIKAGKIPIMAITNEALATTEYYYFAEYDGANTKFGRPFTSTTDRYIDWDSTNEAWKFNSII